MNGYMKHCLDTVKIINESRIQTLKEEREGGESDFYQSEGANETLSLREVKKIYDTLRAEILPKTYDLLNAKTDLRHICLLRRGIIQAFKKHGVKKIYKEDLLHDGYEDLVDCLDFYCLWKLTGQ